MHKLDEAVALADLAALADIYAEIIRAALGLRPSPPAAPHDDVERARAAMARMRVADRSDPARLEDPISQSPTAARMAPRAGRSSALPRTRGALPVTSRMSRAPLATAC
jgi:hypothetical protein